MWISVLRMLAMPAPLLVTGQNANQQLSSLCSGIQEDQLGNVYR
jgi:hypothetical protein